MWMDKLERKIGRFAIPHLMRYIVFGNVAVLLISMFQPSFVNTLVLAPEPVLNGQIWRLISFIFIPPSGYNIFFVLISLYCYYWIADTLEKMCGAFRFNVYYLGGMLLTIITTFITNGIGIPTYINQFLFITLASVVPETPILLMYIFPMKAKWAAIVSGVFLAYDFFTVGAYLPVIRYLMLAALINYILFFLPSFIARQKNKRRRQAYERMSAPRQPKAQRRVAWQEQPKARPHAEKEEKGKIITGVPFHRCHVCGITDVDDPNMTFRYCSQCNGNYEYCENHLHNHEHVK